MKAVVCYRKRYPTLPRDETARRGWGTRHLWLKEIRRSATTVVMTSLKDQGFGCGGACAEVDAACIGVGSFTMAAAPGSSRSFR